MMICFIFVLNSFTKNTMIRIGKTKRLHNLYFTLTGARFRIITIIFLLIVNIFCLPAQKKPQLPAPPGKYKIPKVTISISSAKDFVSVFTSPNAKDIVLEDGLYFNSGPVKAGSNHRIWARHAGKAILKFGLAFTGIKDDKGGEIHGIRFELDSSIMASSGSIIHTSDPGGDNLKIFDCWFYGNHKVRSGVYARAVSGLVVRRCIVNGFTDYGIAFMGASPGYNKYTVALPPVIEDIDISSVYRSPKLSSNGTAEAGLWAGTNCSVSRIRITDVSWMGIWTGANCNNSVFSDLTIDNITPQGTGIYVEHYTRRCVFKDFQIGPVKGFPWQEGHLMRNGVNTEWDNPQVDTNPEGGTKGGSHENIFRDGIINSSMIGIAQEDAENTTIESVTFINQSAAAIKEFRTNDKNYNTVWKGKSNDFSGMVPSAVEYTTEHSPFGFTVQPENVNTSQGEIVVFKSKAGSATYQWQKNDQDIPGATEAEYSFKVEQSDNGSQFSVIATSKSVKIKSRDAILKVTE